MEAFQKGVPKYEIHNPNFDQFFESECAKIEERHRQLLPPELKAKLFRGERLTPHRLTVLEKIYVLNIVFGRECAIVIYDENNPDGLTPGEIFDKAKKVQEREISLVEFAEEIVRCGMFVLSDADIMECVAVTRFTCVNAVYKKIIPAAKRASNRIDSDYMEQSEAFKAVVRMLYRYEAGKRLVIADYGLNVPEWYSLLHYFFGEKNGSSFYDDVFHKVQNANRATLKRALTRMANEGYLLTRGSTQKKLYRLAPKGMRIITEVFDRVVFK